MFASPPASYYIAAMQARLKDLGLKVGVLEPGPLNHIMDVPGGVGVAHRTYRDAKRGVCTGFTVIQTSAEVAARRAAGVHALNGAGEMTGSYQIREWGYLETPIVFTNTPGVGRAYEAASQWMMKKVPQIGNEINVMIPIVGECDDSALSDPRVKAWGDAEVAEALDESLALAQGRAKPSAEALAQGSVGGGTGTACFELKAGIGSASRRVKVRGRQYTVGVLLQTNYGHRHQFTFLGKNVGPDLKMPLPTVHREGSCVGALATDAPLPPPMLERLAVRMGMGLARTGSHAHHGSGEIFVAFSTAEKAEIDLHWESDDFNPFFWAAIEATEESVYNSILNAQHASTSRGSAPAIDIPALLNLLKT